MQIVVLNGRLSEAEEDAYIRQVTRKIPMSIIDKLILDIQGDHINVRYVLHQFRDGRRMHRCTGGLELRQAGGAAGHRAQPGELNRWIYHAAFPLRGRSFLFLPSSLFRHFMVE